MYWVNTTAPFQGIFLTLIALWKWIHFLQAISIMIRKNYVILTNIFLDLVFSLNHFLVTRMRKSAVSLLQSVNEINFVWIYSYAINNTKKRRMFFNRIALWNFQAENWINIQIWWLYGRFNFGSLRAKCWWFKHV